MHLFLLTSLVAAATPSTDYVRTIERVSQWPSNTQLQSQASRHGLSLLNVLWEDTGRWQGSSVGPNISDVTIEVGVGEGSERRAALMPVLRFPNFADKTADVRLDKFYVPVGNQKDGKPLTAVTLREFLAHPTRFLSSPDSGIIKGGSLLAERDSHALVSAQATFLPVPANDQATFYPVIFNYQSTREAPAVLTLLVTRQGTSMTVIDNTRDTIGGSRSWGQRLFFNSKGERAPLTAERLSDVERHGVTANGEQASSLGEDMNLLMLIQVPLKYPERRQAFGAFGALGGMAAPPPAEMSSAASQDKAELEDDSEVAVLGHGVSEGPYTELGGHSIERDPRFPVRVTVQFYQATSSASLSDATLARLASQISKVYNQGDYVGSLVVPSGRDSNRPTNWTGVSQAPKDVSWWDFPGLVERYRNHGECRPSARAGIFNSARECQ